MAKDFGRFGIRVNACRMGWIGGAPVYGYIDNQVNNGRKREDVINEITDRIPIGIIPPEEDCAKAVLYFVSDYAKVVTGATLDVNGGQYMAP
jgi:NAD(P)-dependent dehydrogenase (short-subunit alcohol dehydrogenase family)